MLPAASTVGGATLLGGTAPVLTSLPPTIPT